jgi:signal transduction histidine kinase
LTGKHQYQFLQTQSLVADLNSSFQLIQNLLIAIEQGAALKSIAQNVAEFWDATACGIWDGQQLAWYSSEPNLPEPSGQTWQLPALPIAGYKGELRAELPGGYLILLRPAPWPAKTSLEYLIPVLSIGLSQHRLQQEVLTAAKTLRQAQTLADERTAQLQSSQGLLGKLQAAGRRRVEQLDEANRLKDEFISTISHELRTPLTSMSLAIKMLRQPGIDLDRQTRYLDILQQQCAQEINLINDLLTIQQLEAKQGDTGRQLILLDSLLQPLLDRFQQTWASKNLQLQVAVPANCQFHSENDSLTRVLQELLTNAGKYAAPNTTVELKAEIVAGKIIITVIDQGKLINATDLPHIFQKFRRGQDVTKQAIPGTGLGLALVKSLVQHLQGEVSVTSTGIEPLAITSFQLSFPLEER